MKILITGSSGFVGSHLVNKLSKKHTVIGYDLVNKEDILDEKLLSKKLRGVDMVIHLAAFISATESWEKPLDYMRNNTLGTLSVVDCAIKVGVKKMIFFSSAAVKAKPLTPYAISKINAENILSLYKNRMNIVIVRPENIYGPGQKANYGYVIHNFIKAVRSGDKINIYGNGKQTRDFVYVDDVVESIDSIIEKKIKNETLNIGTGNAVSIKYLAFLVCKILKRKTPIQFKPARNEPRNSFADVRTLSRVGIDYKKFKDVEEGIKDLLLRSHS